MMPPLRKTTTNPTSATVSISLYCLSPGFLCHFGSHANAPALVQLFPAPCGHIPSCCGEALGMVVWQGIPPLRLRSWVSALSLACQFPFSLPLSYLRQAWL